MFVNNTKQLPLDTCVKDTAGNNLWFVCNFVAATSVVSVSSNITNKD